MEDEGQRERDGQKEMCTQLPEADRTKEAPSPAFLRTHHGQAKTIGATVAWHVLQELPAERSDGGPQW